MVRSSKHGEEDFLAVVRDGCVQTRPSFVVLRVDVCPGLEERFHNLV